MVNKPLTNHGQGIAQLLQKLLMDGSGYGIGNASIKAKSILKWKVF